MDKENRQLEYKEALTKQYLKTVSAFSNYDGGNIIFGISDDLKVVPLENIDSVSLSIETQINDSIKPKPDFSLTRNDNGTLTLHVEPGPEPPYFYNGKAYKRNDTSTVEVSFTELRRLSLKGMGKNYESVQAPEQNLTFNTLKERLQPKLELSAFNIDTLKTLNLYSVKEGYNIAAYLLADKNKMPGLDIAVYGNNANEFRKRKTLAGESVLLQYEDALRQFDEEYRYERINGGYREVAYRLPKEAYREALANAIIHRSYDINANTKVEMMPDQIQITSPGGLPEGIEETNFLNGNISSLRNPILSNVFYRLSIVEIFATGIKRIHEAYKGSLAQPVFEVFPNVIKITLPVPKTIQLTQREEELLKQMIPNEEYTRNDLEEKSKYSKYTLLRILSSLLEKKLIVKTENGRATKYKRL